MKASNGQTPGAITPEEPIENLNSMEFESSSRAAQHRLRQECLRRDGWRCVVTKFWDPKLRLPHELLSCPLEAAHILPFSLGSFFWR